MSAVMKTKEVSEIQRVANSLSDLPTANFTVPLWSLEDIIQLVEDLKTCGTPGCVTMGDSLRVGPNDRPGMLGHVYLGGGTLISEVEHRFIRAPEEHEIREVASLEEGLAMYLENQGKQSDKPNSAKVLLA